jgi:hypothetical protein
MAKKNVKVRDLKPNKDAKGGGGHTLSGGLHGGPAHGQGTHGPSQGQGTHGPAGAQGAGGSRGGN